MYCTNCGKEVNGTPFCPYCGSKLEVRNVCNHCGQEIQGTPFCPYCGKSQNTAKRTSGIRMPGNPVWKKSVLIGAAVLLVLMILGAISNDDDPGEKRPEKEAQSIAETTAPIPEPAPEKEPETIPAEETVRNPEDTRKEQYTEAVQLYGKGDYYAAQELFESLSDYSDSQKYLRLIRIRFAGTNIGVGSKVYSAECGLTESEKWDIDKAAADFYFADTAEVLVCNSDVASYYLIGDWNGGSKCYIHFIANNYGCRYNIGSKLSTNYQDTFGIYDGILYVDVVDSWAKTLKLTLLSPDCMEVCTYEKGGNTYVLTRE